MGTELTEYMSTGSKPHTDHSMIKGSIFTVWSLKVLALYEVFKEKIYPIIVLLW